MTSIQYETPRPEDLSCATEAGIASRFSRAARVIAIAVSRKLRNRIPVEDLTQVALMSCIQSVRNYAHDRGTLADWVIPRMRFAIADAVRTELRMRSHGRGVQLISRDDPDSSASAARGTHTQGKWRSIEAALDLGTLMDRLEPVTRAILRRRMEGETMLNIANDGNFKVMHGHYLMSAAMKQMRAYAGSRSYAGGR